MIKSKKQMFIIISVFALVLFLGGTTFAWFNYRRTSSDQQMIAGEIYLHLNEGTNQISMTNVFPETAVEARARNDNYITFTVDGLNTSNKTIYYEFILDHGDDKASPKTRYRDEDLRFDLVELDSSGNETNYLLSAANYETLVNRRIYVNTVDANTTTEIVRRYKLRMWLDENVVISDTAADAVYNTTEYKNKYATVKLTVAGDFQEKTASKSLYQIMREENIGIDTDNGVDFSKISDYDGLSGNGTKGVYMRAGTENETYPIVYYRGAVENNNIIFADKCWQAVRSTETGGVKLIYNGEKQLVTTYDNDDVIPDTDINYTNDGTYPYTYDSTTMKWTSGNAGVDSSTSTFVFTVKEAGDYTINYTVSSQYSDYGKFYKNNTLLKQDSSGNSGSILIENLTTTDEIKVEFVKDSKIAWYDDNVSFEIVKHTGTKVQGYWCNNTGTDMHLEISGTKQFSFNTSSDSPAYVGYMYGDVYQPHNEEPTSGAYFGTGFTYVGGVYKLTNPSTTLDANHHYTCNKTSSDGTCATIRYYYYVSGTFYRDYIELTGGDGVEEAIKKMQTNTNDSNIKNKIDTWYAANMTSYTNKLEDTLFCNDRSFGDGNNNGWIANGGSLITFINYGAKERSNNAESTSTKKNQPSLICPNKNDSFTWKNSKGNQALDYPVALITEDEMVLAGGSAIANSSFYLNNGNVFWSMSPDFSDSWTSYGFDLSHGHFDNANITSTYGIRPVISLKPGTLVSNGEGTISNPYIIE